MTSRLWAPWRMTYIRGAESAPRGEAGRRSKERCLFCDLEREGHDREHLVLARRRNGLLMLNRYPYNPAHLMVATRRHIARFADLTLDERGDLMDLTALGEQALAAEYRPQGINYGANSGGAAGAGFPGHLHLHLVPRWNGDTNFMPTIAETKVLPEALGRTWSRLKRAIRTIEAALAQPLRGAATRRTRVSRSKRTGSR